MIAFARTIVLLALARHVELAGKRRAYRAALANYGAAFACAVRETPDNPA